MFAVYAIKKTSTLSTLLVGLVLWTFNEMTLAFQAARPVVCSNAPVPTTTYTQRAYSLDSYLETLSEIQNTVHTAAGSSNTQAYLESLAILNNKTQDHWDQSEGTVEFISRTSFSCMNYLEGLSDAPSTKRVEMLASNTPNIFDAASPLAPDTVESVQKSTNQLSTGSSLKVDTPEALRSTPPDQTQPILPRDGALFNKQPTTAAGVTRKRQIFSPDSTMPSLQSTKFSAPSKQHLTKSQESSSTTDNASFAMKGENVDFSRTSPSSEELSTRIAMAAEYVAAEQPWDLETIKAMSPLTSITTVLADINEHNSHVALQNGQDEVTKSLTKWIKSTQKIGKESPTHIAKIPKEAEKLVQNMDMSIGEFSERIAQGFFSLGELVVTVLNLVAESVGGKSLSVAAKSAQEAATEAIASAVASVMTTVQKVGDVSVADVMQSMVELIIIISRVIFRIFNGALEIVSGKNVGQMGQSVTNSFEKEARALSTRKTDLSETSLYDLVVMLGKFELEAAEAVMTTGSNAVQSLEVGTILGRQKKAPIGI